MGARETRALQCGLWLGAFLLVGVLDVQASRLVYRDVSLPQALREAEAVVCARYLGRHPKAKGVMRFVAQRQWRGKGLKPGQAFEVWSLEARAWQRVAQVYRNNRTRRSPLLKRLRPAESSALRQAERYCLMLRRGPGSRWTLAVADGHIAAPCTKLRRQVTDSP